MPVQFEENGICLISDERWSEHEQRISQVEKQRKTINSSEHESSGSQVEKQRNNGKRFCNSVLNKSSDFQKKKQRFFEYVFSKNPVFFRNNSEKYRKRIILLCSAFFYFDFGKQRPFMPICPILHRGSHLLIGRKPVSRDR